MKAIVNADGCVGCGLCVNVCAEVFQMEDDKAIVILDPIPDEMEESAKEATSSCPVEAIVME
ncbi:MAG: ferredoxin [PVC group bacterium]|nr:ferredoxin [PVC group bacterium]